MQVIKLIRRYEVGALSGFVEISFGDEDYDKWYDETLDEFSDWL